MVTIKEQLVSSRQRTFPGINGRKFITIHETANYARGAGAQVHADLQSSGFSASWHWQVDDKIAIQSFPHTVRCWHAGDGAGNGNYHSIAIEICVNADGNFQQAVKNAADLVKKIMRDEGIPIANVVQHHHWSGKNCPYYLRSGNKGMNWSSFKSLIQTNTLPSPSTLAYGSKGDAVKQLQVNLNKLGYKVAADGSFGPATEQALKAFQASRKLTADGIYGPLTQKALTEALAKLTSMPSVQVLRYGDKGASVKQLQTNLNKLGYKLTVDSSYGPATERAVKSFQSSQKLTADGIYGPLTQKALNEALTKPVASTRSVLKYGDIGEDVRAMQTALVSLNFYPDKGAKNNGIDGSFGTKTRDAVRRFQAVYTPAEVDGIFGPKTRAAVTKAIQNKRT